jgi:hypothetical protein
VFAPTDLRLGFDPNSSEIRWRIGEVKAGTGVVTPALIGAFQISLIPAESDVNAIIPLVREARLIARDTFTGDLIEERIEVLNTELRDDPLTRREHWTVVR